MLVVGLSGTSLVPHRSWETKRGSVLEKYLMLPDTRVVGMRNVAEEQRESVLRAQSGT